MGGSHIKGYIIGLRGGFWERRIAVEKVGYCGGVAYLIAEKGGRFREKGVDSGSVA